MALTGFALSKENVKEAYCTGIFNDHDQILNPQILPKIWPQPKSIIFWTISITIFVLMVAITIQRHKTPLQGQRNKHTGDIFLIWKTNIILENHIQTKRIFPI